MAFGRKKNKDEVGAKRKDQKKTPYRKCNVVFKTKKMPNGSVVNLYCTKNGNVKHRHGN